MFYQACRRVASTQSRRQPEATELLPLPERPCNPRRGVRWRCVYAVYSQVRPFTHDRICTLTLGIRADPLSNPRTNPDYIQYPGLRGLTLARSNPGNTTARFPQR